MNPLILYLETRIEALDTLIEIHDARTGDYLVMERAICCLQLDKIKQKRYGSQIRKILGDKVVEND